MRGRLAGISMSILMGSILVMGSAANGQEEAEPVVDAETKQELDEAAQAALEAATHVMKALSIFIERLPRYETPEVLPNGDILIRRLPSDEEESEETAAAETSSDETSSE